MTINDLVDRIYRLNDVKDGFWKEYLEEIRSDFKVTWHRSCGMDFRPLILIWSLTDNNYWNWRNKRVRKFYDTIGKEIQRTDIVFSDAAGYYTDYYDTLLNLHNEKRLGIFDQRRVIFNTDVYYRYTGERENWNRKNCGGITTLSISSIEPFKIFTKEERKELALLQFKNHNGHDVGPIVVNVEREFDGFAIKMNNFSSSDVTVIYLCLDDRIVKKVFDDFQIEVVCLFENRTGGKAGGLPLGWLFENADEIKKMKYICSDKCDYDEEKKSFRLNYEYDYFEDEYIVEKYFPMTGFGRGEGFCLAIRKCQDDKGALT